MPGFKLLTSTSRFEPILWMSLSTLLLFGIASTVIDLRQLPIQEMRKANKNGQRAVIDPATGMVSLGALLPKDKEAFDVGEGKKEADKPAETPDAPPAEPLATEPPQATSPEGLPVLRTAPTNTSLGDVQASGDTLVQAPAPEVTEKKGDVMLPKRNGEVTPSAIYAKRFTRTPEQHLLSIVVLDAGLSAQSLPLIMGLPKETTVAFSPYAAETKARIATLRKAGYEVWGMAPAMGAHYPKDDPGPLGLVATLPKDEIMRRLHVVMAETIGSAGIVLPPDEILSTKAEAFSPILAEIDARGLNVLSTNQTRTAKQVSGTTEIKSTIHRADMMLDPVPDEAAINKKLGEITELLKTKDTVVVVTSARPQTLLLLQKWLHDHPLAAPSVLAPLSAHWLPKEAPQPPAEEESGGHGSSGGHGAPKAEGKKEEKKSGGHH